MSSVSTLARDAAEVTPTDGGRDLEPSDSRRQLWPSDTEGREWLELDNMPETVISDEAEPVADGRAVRENLTALWAEAAVTHAIVRAIEDPPGLVATVAGLDGAWGFGESPREALDDLKSVLIDWASLKLDDGDDDIPSMEGIHLVLNP